MFVKLFEEFINELDSSSHYLDRVSERINGLVLDSIRGYTKNKADVLSRCKKLLLSKIVELEKKSFLEDRYDHIEDFGEIIVKDSTGEYRPIFSTDGGKNVGNKFIAIIRENNLVTMYLVKVEKSKSDIIEMVASHMNKLSGRKGSSNIMYDMVSDGNKVIDMDLSDVDFYKSISNTSSSLTVATPATKIVKEITVSKGYSMVYIVEIEGVQVYRQKKVLETIYDKSERSLLVKFEGGGIKKFMRGDAPKINKKFVFMINDRDASVGNIIDIMIKDNKTALKVEVSHVVKDIVISTPPEKPQI